MEPWVSFSGGVESSTLCLLFGHRANGIFADAGWEHAVMYDRLRLVEDTIRQQHPQFQIVRVRAENVEGTGTSTLPEYIRHRRFYPSPWARFCTRLFKIEPIDRFLSSLGSVELMIGLNWDERDNRDGNHGLQANVTYSYPLVDLRMTRADCLAVLREHNLEPQLPPYMTRGGCIGCPFKRKSEYADLAVLNPAEMQEVIELEEAIQDRRGKFYAVRDGIKNMRRFAERSRSQGRLFPLEQVSPVQSTPCGVFCHR